MRGSFISKNCALSAEKILKRIVSLGWEVEVVQSVNSCLSFSQNRLYGLISTLSLKDPMQKAYKVETSISHDLAELYSILDRRIRSK